MFQYPWQCLRGLVSINYDFFKGTQDRYSATMRRKKSGKMTFPEPKDVLSRPYCFVLSTGRCGTALLTKVLKRAPELYVKHNPKPELELASSVVYREQPSVDALEISVLAARFDVFFLEAWLREKIYVETNNRITFFAPALRRLLPNAKFIHLVRNPVDFCRSGMRRGYYLPNNVQHQRLHGRKGDAWGGFSRLEKIAWEWNEINGAIEQFKLACEADKVLTIKSEDFYRDIEVARRIFEFLKIEYRFGSRRGQRSLERLLATPVNAQKTGNYPEYGNWSEADKRAVWRVATLSRVYGYYPGIGENGKGI